MMRPPAPGNEELRADASLSAKKSLTVIRIKRKRQNEGPSEILVDESAAGGLPSLAPESVAERKALQPTPSKRQATDQMLAEMLHRSLATFGRPEASCKGEGAAEPSTSSAATTGNDPGVGEAAAEEGPASAEVANPSRPLARFKKLRTVSIKDAHDTSFHRDLLVARRAARGSDAPSDPGPSRPPPGAAGPAPVSAPKAAAKERHMERARERQGTRQRAARYHQVQVRREAVGARGAEGPRGGGAASVSADVQFLDVYDLEVAEDSPGTPKPAENAAGPPPPGTGRKKPSGLSRNPHHTYMPEQLSAPAVLTMNGLAMVREKVVPPPPPAAWEEPGPSDEWVYDYYVQDDDDGAEGGEDIEGEEGGALDHRPVVTISDTGEWTLSDHYFWAAQIDSLRAGEDDERSDAHDSEDSNAESYFGNDYPDSDEAGEGFDSDMDRDEDQPQYGRRAWRHHRDEATYDPDEEYCDYDPDDYTDG